MRVDRLFARDFRTYERLEMDLDGDLHVLCGDNGAGKTNVLEAVYLLATLKSFRGGRNRELVRSGAREALLEARVTRAGLAHRYEVTIHAGVGKRTRLDGKDPRTFGEYFSGLKAVAFTPDDVAALTGPPAGRRALVDRAVFDLDPSYLGRVREAAAVLAQRGELLRGARRPDAALLAAFTERLAVLGGRVIEERLAFLRSFAPLYREAHRALTGRDDGAEVRYRPSVKLPSGQADADALADVLRGAFAERGEEERRRRQNLVGPQRDDLVLLAAGIDLRTYGSRGQVRAAALAWKLAHLRRVAEETSEPPVFLLDDLGSELDPERNERLLERLRSHQGQVLITTTHLDTVRLPRGAYVAWKVTPGAAVREG